MKLLCEVVEETSVIKEAASDGSQQLFIEGPALIADMKNKNGRVYPKSVLKEAVDQYIEEYVKTNRAVGELGHPAGPGINLDKISHKFISIHEDGNRFIARAKITTKTPMGALAAGLIEDGVQLGFSSRGTGAVKQSSKGLMEVQQGFKIATAADLVQDPSAHGAFVRALMENTEWVFDVSKGTWAESHVEQMHDSVKKLSMKQINERKLDLFESFVSHLSMKRKI